MENKDYINEIIGYLKDDRPVHANVSMRRYMEHLGFTENEIGKEVLYIPELLNEKNIKIAKLQQKLDEQQKNINEVLVARKDSYYIGLLTGLAGIIFGVFINNILYVFPGIAVSIISIVGLYEAKLNKW